MILKDIGITVNLTEMPEHKEYAEYYLNRGELMRCLLLMFRRAKVEELQFKVQCALLNAVLEKGSELIKDKPEGWDTLREEDMMDDLGKCYRCGTPATKVIPIGSSYAKGSFTPGNAVAPVCDEYPECVVINIPLATLDVMEHNGRHTE